MQHKLDKKTKNIWEWYAKNYLKTIDFAGAPIMKSAFGNPNSVFGWNVDHICPKSSKYNFKGSEEYSNLQPTNIETNTQKKDLINGEICHEYYENNNYKYSVITSFEIKYNPFYLNKSHHNINGIIFIKKQLINYGKSVKNIIDNIYFYDCVGYYFNNKKNQWFKSKLDLEKSLDNNCLFFVNGNNPEFWNKHVNERKDGSLVND